MTLFCLIQKIYKNREKHFFPFLWPKKVLSYQLFVGFLVEEVLCMFNLLEISQIKRKH